MLILFIGSSTGVDRCTGVDIYIYIYIYILQLYVIYIHKKYIHTYINWFCLLPLASSTIRSVYSLNRNDTDYAVSDDDWVLPVR